MAPPTPFKTHFDLELKDHVVQVQDRMSGELMPYIYNHDMQRFEPSTAPDAVYETDLLPLYESNCQRNRGIMFCRNAKTDKVYKYLLVDANYRRVQCLCCEFNPETRIDNAWSASIRSTMTPGKRVDEVNGNCLLFRPAYSKWCENTQKITVFAGVFPKLEDLYPWNFDLQKQTFVKSECHEACCKERILDPLAPKTFDFGNQGQCFARSHHDQAGRSLICLAISWYNKEHGQMEIFMDQDGDIGMYEWNDRLKCFFLQKTLDVRCLSHPYNGLGKYKSLWYDNDLRYMFHMKCPALNEDIYFCWHLIDGKTRKYIFNPVTLQFVLVKCPCCGGGEYTANTNVGTLGVYMCPATQGQVMISKNKDGILEKVMVTVYGTRVTLPASPIRIDSYFAPKEIICRRQSENQHITQMTQLFTAEGLEGWVLRTQRTSSDGCTQIGTMALMDGSVKPITLDCNRYNFAIYHHDCVDLAARDQQTKPQDHMTWKRYALDWDLLPEKSVRCVHSVVPIMLCYNTFSGKRGYYILDMRSGHIMEHPGCHECICDPANIVSIAPSTVIFNTSSPLSPTDVFVATNSDGYLVKVSKNPLNDGYSGMLPLRIVTPDEVFHSFYGLEHVNLWQLSALQNTLRHNEEQHAQMEHVIQGLETRLSLMTFEAERERRRADVAENTIVNRDNTPLLDMDLSPMYRNYCPHTGHFFITSLNNRDQSIGHFVFNPVTGHFHQQDYCEACSDYTNGIKVQNFVTLMPAESPLTKFPFLVMTDDNGRLVKIGFCTEARGFVSQPASVIQPAVQDIRMIPNSMRAKPTCLESPLDRGGPYDCYLIPHYRVYCLHCKEFLLYGFHKELQANGYFMYNSKTGHLEEHPGCASCERMNPRYDIDAMHSVMPVVSPYSKWPLMLTTNIHGELIPIAFKTENHRFNSMPRLKIVMMNERSPRRYPQEIMNVLPVTQKAAKVPPVIDEPVLEMNPPAPVPVVASKLAPKVIPRQASNPNDCLPLVYKMMQVPEIGSQSFDPSEDMLQKTLRPTGVKIVQGLPPVGKPSTEEDSDLSDEDYSDEEEDEEYSDEEEDEEEEEEKVEDTKNPVANDNKVIGMETEASDNSDEEYSDEDEEEEEYFDEEEVEEAKPPAPFTFQHALQQTTQHLRAAFSNFLSANRPSTSQEDEEELSDEEEWCCSDEECCCSDEECSDEECSDEECSDEECSDEECSDEECSDDECSDEKCSDEECECSECDCDDEEDEEWSDDEPEDAEESGKSAQEYAAEERKRLAEERRKMSEEELKEVQRVCNFEPTATTSAEPPAESELNLHPDFSVSERKFEEARAELREEELAEKLAREPVVYLEPELLPESPMPKADWPEYIVLPASCFEPENRSKYISEEYDTDNDVSDEEVSDEEVYDEDEEEEEEEMTQPSTSTATDFEKMAKERGQTLEEFSDHLVSRFYSEVVAPQPAPPQPVKRPFVKFEIQMSPAPSPLGDVMEDDESEESELSRVLFRNTECACTPFEPDVSITNELRIDEDSDSDISRVESIGIQDISDTESVCTALEPDVSVSNELRIVEDDSEDSDLSRVESIGIHDISDTESVCTALEPDVSINNELKIDEEIDDSEDIFIRIQDISVTESVCTALELDVTQDSVSTDYESEDELSLTDLVAPLQETSSDSESEPDISLSESTATALEPESEEIDEDNLSILSTTSTAKEFSIAHDSESSAGSDISYLDDLSGIDDVSYEHPDDHVRPAAAAASVDPINSAVGCVIA